MLDHGTKTQRRTVMQELVDYPAERMPPKRFDLKTIGRLESLGFEMVGPSEAFLDVKPPTTIPNILAYEESPIQVTRVTTYRLIYPPLYRTSSIISTTCTKYMNPKAAFSIIPVKAKNMKFRIWGLKFEGDMETRLKNIGEDGQEGKHVMRWIQWMVTGCPTSDDKYDWEWLKNTAALRSNSYSNSFYEDRNNEYLAKISQKIGDASTGRSSLATAHFNTGGLGGFFWTLIQILTTGTITTRNGFDVTAHYDWLGKTYEVKRHVNSRTVLPIEGGISVGI